MTKKPRLATKTEWKSSTPRDYADASVFKTFAKAFATAATPKTRTYTPTEEDFIFTDRIFGQVWRTRPLFIYASTVMRISERKCLVLTGHRQGEILDLLPHNDPAGWERLE